MSRARVTTIRREADDDVTTYAATSCLLCGAILSVTARLADALR